MKRFIIPMIFIACNSYAAGIQKWTDESGNVHYGDMPPLKTKTESIHVNRAPSNPGKPLPRFTGSNAEKKTTEAKAGQKEQNRTTDEVNKQVCDKAKVDLDVISRNALIRLKSSDGTERVLSDEEVDARRLKLEKDVKQYCN